MNLNFAVVLGLTGLAAAGIAAEPEINDAFLLRAFKRFPAADKDQNGRLTPEEWIGFQEQGRRLRRDMNEEEARVQGSSDRGARVAPTHAELVYGPLAEQRLNLWITPSSRPTPLIVHIHGGGFIQGSKQPTLAQGVHEKLTANGVSYASVQYRFQSKDFPLPNVLRGIARAVQYLRHTAPDWNLDRERVAAFGSSAGGAASAWLGMRNDLADPHHTDPVLRESSRVQAVWAISVAATMDVWEWPKYNPMFTEEMIPAWITRWGYDPNTNPQRPESIAWRREVHFPHWASPDDAPMVIYNEHFADNVAHNPHSSKALYDNCRKAGMDVALYMREIVHNLDQSPDLFDWMIKQLKQQQSNSNPPHLRSLLEQP
jgi:acetyl esterase/lipase